MPELKFSCTMCGRCCHNHNLPLTLDEAVSWLEEEGQVSIYCEADIWPEDPPDTDARAAHRKRRSFPALCGSSRVRITALLVGMVSGPCKNLSADLKCRIYERRPLVCRIYPAEINPFIQLEVANKACPAEAWGSGETLMVDGRIVDPGVQLLIERSRQIDQDDVPQKNLLCAYLGIDVAGIFGEGFVAYTPDRNSLLATLRRVRVADVKNSQNEREWRLYSPSAATTDCLQRLGMTTIDAKPAEVGFVSIAAPAGARM